MLCLVLTVLLATGAQAFVSAPIRWTGLPAKKLVLAPKANSHSAFVPNGARAAPQMLTFSHREMPPDEVPYFTTKPDNTIAWVDGSGNNLCIEASGVEDGDVVRISQCSAGPTQLWNLLPSGDGGRNQIQLQHTNKCMNANLDEAPVDLRECGKRDTDSFEFAQPLPVDKAIWEHSVALASSIRHMLIGLLALSLFVPLGLSAYLWRWQRGPRPLDVSQGSPPEQGGVALTIPLAISQGSLPELHMRDANVVDDPTSYDKRNANIICDQVKPDTSFRDISGPPVLETISQGSIFHDTIPPTDLASGSPGYSNDKAQPSFLGTSQEKAQAFAAIDPKQGRFHRFVASEEAFPHGYDSRRAESSHTCVTPCRFQGTRNRGAHPGSSRIHFTLPGKDEEPKIIELMHSNEVDNPSFAALRVKLPLDTTIFCKASRLVVKRVGEERSIADSRILPGDIIRAISLSASARTEEEPWWAKIGQNPIPPAEEGMVVLDGKSVGDFNSVLQENLRANGTESEVVLLIERPVSSAFGQADDNDFWKALFSPFRQESVPELVPLPIPITDSGATFPRGSLGGAIYFQSTITAPESEIGYYTPKTGASNSSVETMPKEERKGNEQDIPNTSASSSTVESMPKEERGGSKENVKAYNPDEDEKYYQSRFPQVISRLASLTSLTLGFNLRLLFDYLAYKRAGEPEFESWPNEKDRAKEALGLATELGPTFIKLAQALSIRTDLIPEAYAMELRELQDRVPAFDSATAKGIIRQELGVDDLSTIFSELSEEPLAAASIGQVYKGVLKDGRTVAVKVQRPNILDEITLDLYLLRKLAPLQTRISNRVNNIKTYPEDLKLARELVDEWGRGFVAETDYRYEAANTEEFREAMQRRGLDAVTSPAVVKELSTEKVLVTEWIDGTRLDLDASPDVARLCKTAINAYLTMLLDTGVLHCDPHPGNLLRTRDGKLCILDWGMTLGVPGDLQYSLIEFIAHVTSEDMEAIPQDFVNLGFTPPEELERLKASNLSEGLTFVLRQLSKGGGGKKLQSRVKEEMKERYDPEGKLSREELREKMREDFANQARDQLEKEGVQDVRVMDVQAVMEKMQQRNRALFKVPPYLLYLTRAFSTLEGIGLSSDEDYAIVTEAFPYVSQRLLKDENPRAKAALRSLVYGSAEKDASNASPDVKRFITISEGFSSYTDAVTQVPGEASLEDATKSISSTGTVTPATSGAVNAADDLIDLLLSADGNYVQELLLEEAAKLADAAVRDTISQVSTTGPINAIADALRTPKQIAQSNISSLPQPLKGVAEAALGPLTVLDEISRVVPALGRTKETDEESLKAFGMLWERVSPSAGSTAVANQDGTSEAGAREPSSVTTTNDRPFLEQVQTNAGPLLEQAQSSAGPLLDQLGDSDSRLRKRLPLIGTLSRRFASILLRRVAQRLEDDSTLPETSDFVRGVAAPAAQANRSLASLVEPSNLVSTEVANK